ncbi:efflux RND transporter periplasmic adaptor subunit [Paraburkholderia silviterrae]|uniref:Efflux RND transporter periplasmic adaptor subunit n=1 Tax=Paraburkholderia silviterrae TaxID=2528715 RepID=A0A4R5M741_9BURK|nr:efflux RND transporter periplasmic adaptor subunit [Paraburkholderia silviterrae]TDG22008.1 efflux RND transporter periplasmic adaptor subunit [Paraburkholderia silviterrae]
MTTQTPLEDRDAAPEPEAQASSALPPSPSPSAVPSTRTRKRHALVLGLGALVLALLAAGIVPKLDARKAQAAQVAVQRELSVATVAPKPAPATQDLLLPGAVMPWADASIYARTSGYVQHWYADIGAHVKAGQTLAQIDTPELDAQLQQARADEATAQANYRFASSTAQRWQTMLQTQSVAQQDADAKTSDAAAKLATLQATQANVARLQEMVAYQNVTAPFDGVITVRNVQVGALVTAGGTPGLATMPGELFHIEQTDRLRVYVDVPQDDASRVTPGTAVWLTTQQYPGRRFPATVARSANAIDPVSRTLHVEVDVDNADGALMPGAYAQVHLALTTTTPALEVPVSALLFRPDGVTVAVVDAHDKVQLRQVSIGRDFGTYVEIATGLAPTDRVINNPGDAIANGQSVRVAAGSTDAAGTPAVAAAAPGGKA